MPEQRGRKHHQDRVAGTLRDEISSMIGGELNDPRLGLAYVSEVVLARGGKAARVLVSIDGGEEQERITMEALRAAAGFIRLELKARMGVAHVPELTFHLDNSAHLRARMDELLGRIQQRKTKSEAKTSANAPAAEQPGAAPAPEAATQTLAEK
jgi:ribosome-binding factor A